MTKVTASKERVNELEQKSKIQGFAEHENLIIFPVSLVK